MEDDDVGWRWMMGPPAAGGPIVQSGSLTMRHAGANRVIVGSYSSYAVRGILPIVTALRAIHVSMADRAAIVGASAARRREL